MKNINYLTLRVALKVNFFAVFLTVTLLVFKTCFTVTVFLTNFHLY